MGFWRFQGRYVKEKAASRCDASRGLGKMLMLAAPAYLRETDISENAPGES